MPQHDNISNLIHYYEGAEITPAPGVVFVFGSNPEGRHGAGAAKVARENFGAVYGQGEGPQGNAYAIPTKDLRVKENNGYRSIPPEAITESIRKMYEYASSHPELKFMVAYSNTTTSSLNGYTGLEMIQMFINAGALPSNVYISENWYKTGLFQKAFSEAIKFNDNKNKNDMATYRQLTLAPGQKIDLTGRNITAIMQDSTGFNLYNLTEIVGNESGETLVKGKHEVTGAEYRMPISDADLTINEEDVLDMVIAESLGLSAQNAQAAVGEAEETTAQLGVVPSEQFGKLDPDQMEVSLNAVMDPAAKAIISERMTDSIFPVLEGSAKANYLVETFNMLAPSVQDAIIKEINQLNDLRGEILKGAQQVGEVKVRQESSLNIPQHAQGGNAPDKVSYRKIPMMNEKSYSGFTQKSASGVQPVNELTIIPAAEVKAYCAEHDAVDSLRHPGAFAPYLVKAGEKSVSIETHLGNPFSHESDRMKHTSVKTASVENATKEFEAWLVGAKDLNVEPERKSWLIKNILDGSFFGKPVVYYTSAIPTPKEGADWQKGFGEESQYSMEKAPCHAHIELKYINDPALLVRNINTINALRNQPVSIDEAKAWFRTLSSDQMVYFLNMDNLRQDKPGAAEHPNMEARGIIMNRMQDSILQLMDEPGKAKYFAETFDMLPPIIQADIFNQAAVENALSTMHHWTAQVATQNQETSQAQGEAKTRNIYAGTGENAELSNLHEAKVPYTLPTGEHVVFGCVEQGFQYMKSFFCSNPEEAASYREAVMASTNGKVLRELGRNIKIDIAEWDANSGPIMKSLLQSRFSMENNPEDVELLLSTSTDILTHVQDPGKWRTLFPQYLMEVRQELRIAQGLEAPGKTAASIDAGVPDFRRVHAEDEKAKQEEINAEVEAARSLGSTGEEPRMSPEEWKQYKKDAWRAAAPRIASIWFASLSFEEKQQALSKTNWAGKARSPKYMFEPYVEAANKFVTDALLPSGEPGTRNQILNASFDKLGDDAKLYIFYGVRPELNTMREWMASYLDEIDKRVDLAKSTEDVTVEATVASRERLSDFVRAGYITTEIARSSLVFEGFNAIGKDKKEGRIQEQARQMNAWLHGDMESIQCTDKEAARQRLFRLHNDILDGKFIGRPVLVNTILNEDGSYGGVTKYSYPDAPTPEQVLKHMIDNPEELADIINSTESLWLQRVDNLSFRVAEAYKNKENPLSEEGMELYRKLAKPGDVDQSLDNISSMQPLYAPFDAFNALSHADQEAIVKESPYLAEQIVEAIDYVRESLSDKGSSFKIEIHDSDDPHVILDYFFSMPANDRNLVIKETPGLAEDFTVAFSDAKKSLSEKGRQICTALTSAPKRIVTEEDFMRMPEADRKKIMQLNPAVNKAVVISSSVEKRNRIDSDVRIATGILKSKLVSAGAVSLDNHTPVFASPFRNQIVNGWTMEQVIDATEKWLAREAYTDVEPEKRDTFYRAITSGAFIGKKIVSSEAMHPYAEWLLGTINNPRPLAARFVVATIEDSKNRTRIMKENDPVKVIKSSEINPYSEALSWFSSLNEKQRSTVLRHAGFDYRNEKQKAELELLTTVLSRWTDRPAMVRIAEFRSFLESKPNFKEAFENMRDDSILEKLNALPVENESQLNGMKLSEDQRQALLSFNDTLPRQWSMISAAERTKKLGELIPEDLKDSKYISQLVGVKLTPADSSMLTMLKPANENEKATYALSPSQYASWLLGENPKFMPVELRNVHANILAGKIYPWDLAVGQKAWAPGEGEPQSQEAVLRYYVEHPLEILDKVNDNPAFWVSYKQNANMLIMDAAKPSSTILSAQDKEAVYKVLNNLGMASSADAMFDVLSDEGKRKLMAANPVMKKTQVENGSPVQRISAIATYNALFCSLSKESILRIRDEFDSRKKELFDKSVRNEKLYRNAESAMELFEKETSYEGMKTALDAISEITGLTRSVSTSYLGDGHIQKFVSRYLGPEPEFIDPTLTEDAVLDFVRESIGGSKKVDVEDGEVCITDADGKTVSYNNIDELFKDIALSSEAPETNLSGMASDNDSEMDTNEENEEQLLAEDHVDRSPDEGHADDAEDEQKENLQESVSAQRVLKEANVNINWAGLDEKKAKARKEYNNARLKYASAFRALGAEIIATHGPVAISTLREKVQDWNGVWQNMSLSEKKDAVELFVSEADINKKSQDTLSDAGEIKLLIESDDFKNGKPEDNVAALDDMFENLCPDSKSLITGKVRIIEEIGKTFDDLTPEQRNIMFDLARNEVRKSDRELIAKTLYTGWNSELSRDEAAKKLSSLFRSLAPTSMKKVIAHAAEATRVAGKNVPYNVVTLASGVNSGNTKAKSSAVFFAGMPDPLVNKQGTPSMIVYDTRSHKKAAASNVSKDALKAYCGKNGVVYFDAAQSLFEHGSDAYNSIAKNIREWASTGARVVLVTSSDNLMKCDISLMLCQELFRSNFSVGHIVKGTSGTEVYEHRALMTDFLRKQSESRLATGSIADIEVSVSYDENFHRKVEYTLLNGATTEKYASAASRRLFSEKQANYSTASFQTRVILKDHGFISQEDLIKETANSCDFGIFFVRQNEDSTTIVSHEDTKLAENSIGGHRRITFPSTKEELQDKEALRARVARLLKNEVLVSKITALTPGTELRLFVGGDNIAELTTGISFAGAKQASADTLSQEQNGVAHQEDSTRVIDTNEQVGINDLNQYVRDFMDELAAQLRDYEYIKKTEFNEAARTSIPFRVVNVGESGVQQEVNDKMMELSARFKTESYLAEINHTPRFTTTQPNPQYHKDHNLGKRYADKALFMNYYHRSLPLKYSLEEINRETVTRELDRSAAIIVRGGERDTVLRQTAKDIFYKMGFSSEDSFALSCMLPDGLEEITPPALNAVIRKANRSNEVVMPLNWSPEAVQGAFERLGASGLLTPEARAEMVISSITERKDANGASLPLDTIRAIRLEVASELYAQNSYILRGSQFSVNDDDTTQHIDPLLRAQGLTSEMVNQFRGRSGESPYIPDASKHVGIIDKAALFKAMLDIEAAKSDPQSGAQYILSGQGVASSEALKILDTVVVNEDPKTALPTNTTKVQTRKLQKALARTDIAIGALSEIYRGLDPASFGKVLDAFKTYISQGYMIDNASDLRAFMYALSRNNKIVFPENLTKKCMEESIEYVKDYHAREFNIPEGSTTPEVATLLCRWFGNSMAVRLISVVPDFYKESGHDVCDAKTLMEFLRSESVQSRIHGLPDINGRAFDLENVEHELMKEAEQYYRRLDSKVIGTLTFNDSLYPESIKNADLYIIKTIEAESRDMSNSGIRQKHARIRSKSNLPLLRRWFGESLATTLVNLSDEYKKQTGNAIKDTASLMEFLRSDLVKQSTHGLADENGQAFDWAGKEQELRADAEKHFSSISPVYKRVEVFSNERPILVDLDTQEGRSACMKAPEGTPILAWSRFPEAESMAKYREKVEAGGGVVVNQEAFEKNQLDKETYAKASALSDRLVLSKDSERMAHTDEPEVKERFQERIQDAPTAITYRGNAELLSDPNSLGIISFLGETRISQNENNNQPVKSAVNNIVSELAASQEKVTIAASLNCSSGKAVIEAALNNNLPVVAVTADKLSGSANSELIQRIVAAGGLVVSEADTIQLHDKDVVYNKEILVARSSRLLANIGTMTVAMECLHDNDVRLKADRREYQDVRNILSDKKEGVCVLSYGTTRTNEIIDAYLNVKDGEKINYENLYHTLSINGLVSSGTMAHPDYPATVTSKGIKQYWDAGIMSFKQYMRELHSQMKREPNEFDAAMSLVKKDNVLAISSSGEGVKNMLSTMRSITTNQEYVSNRYSNERLATERAGYGLPDQPTRLIPVYRHADKQVFVVEESLTAVRDCIRRIYGDDVIFAETETGARRIMNELFTLPKTSAATEAYSINDIEMSKTVVVYTSVADDAGQIFSMQNCPVGLIRSDVSVNEEGPEGQKAFLAYVDVTKDTMSVAYEMAGYKGANQIIVPNAIQAAYFNRKIEVYQDTKVVARIKLMNDGSLKFENVNPLTLDKAEHGALEPEFFSASELKNGITVQAFRDKMKRYILSTESYDDARLHQVATDITQSEKYLMEDSQRMREQMEENAGNNEWAHQRGNIETYITEVSRAIERGEIVNEFKPENAYDRAKAYAAFSAEYEKREGEIKKEQSRLDTVKGNIEALNAHASTFTDATDFTERATTEDKLEAERGKVFDIESRIAQMRSELSPILAAMRALAVSESSSVVLLGTENNSVQVKANGKILRESKERMETRLASIQSSLEADKKFFLESTAATSIALDKSWIEKISSEFDAKIDAVREALVAVKGDIVEVKTLDGEEQEVPDSENKRLTRKADTKTVVYESDSSVWKKLSNEKRKEIIAKTARAAAAAGATLRDVEAFYREIERTASSANHNPKDALERGRALFLQQCADAAEIANEYAGNKVLADYLPAPDTLQSQLGDAMEALTFSSSFSANRETLDNEKDATEEALNKATSILVSIQNGIVKYSHDTFERFQNETLTAAQKEEIAQNTLIVQRFGKRISALIDTINELREVAYRNIVPKTIHARSEIRLKEIQPDCATVLNQVGILENGQTQMAPLDVIAIDGVRTVVPAAHIGKEALEKAQAAMDEMKEDIEKRKTELAKTIRSVENAKHMTDMPQKVQKNDFTIFTNTLGKGNNDIFIARHPNGYTYWVGTPEEGHPLSDKFYASAVNFSLIGGRVTQKVRVNDASGQPVEVLRWNIIDRSGKEVLPYPVDELARDRTKLFCLAEGRPLITVTLNGKYNLVDFKTRSFVLNKWQDAPMTASYDGETKFITVSDDKGNKLTDIDLAASRKQEEPKPQAQVKPSKH